MASSQDRPPHGAHRVVTIVRGGDAGGTAAAGRAATVRRVEPATSASPAASAPPAPGGGQGSGATFNGVPVSAAKHCCGKGCKHCRIYWGLRKL